MNEERSKGVVPITRLSGNLCSQKIPVNVSNRSHCRLHQRSGSNWSHTGDIASERGDRRAL